MYCPNCGQQQASEQMRFCSRCGFPLGLVSEILAHGGFLPQLAAIGNKKIQVNRKNGLMFGLAWFLVLTFLLTPIFAVLDFDRLVPLTAILGFMGGIFIMIFSLFLSKTGNAATLPPPAAPPKDFVPQPLMSSNTMPHNALPPQAANFNPVNSASAYAPPQKQPSRGGWRDAETGELIPPSVTESTTRLLDKNE
jgi:hypothetical protein